ncbi:U32 family peptidase [Lyngbya confervoides]|uniref:U32 family peptidase n=1 Tax=Lyngbya confervoides BDU141951 TaxID=1574623 RepID=A0ABD4T3P0_9CYAN|nr:U32 family peptidase [Lyngbya confervoides]MCM1983289.1 U32 family peptidase [Lyngbya confervoides BDU141951]
MLFNTYAASHEDLQQAARSPQLEEVLLEPMLLARQGTLTVSQAQALAQAAQQLNLRPVLVWDILMTESQIQQVGDRLSQWDLSCFSAVRVADVGAALWVKAHCPTLPLQFIAEHGNHNWIGLLTWCEALGPSLDRIVLSIELPEQKLIHYCQSLPVNCEVLGAGPILLFYSPRSLLATQVGSPPQDSQPLIQATLQTEDYGDRSFPVQESLHGTLMYLDKDQFILDRLAPLAAAGLHTVRLDLRHLGQYGQVACGIDQLCDQCLNHPATVQENWPRPTRAPFFRANRTTAVFPHLKSKLMPWRDEACVAVCIGSQRGEYGIFRTLRTFHRSQVKTLMLPSGEELPIPDRLGFYDLAGEALGTCASDCTITMDWIRKLASGAILRTVSTRSPASV